MTRGAWVYSFIGIFFVGLFLIAWYTDLTQQQQRTPKHPRIVRIENMDGAIMRGTYRLDTVKPNEQITICFADGDSIKYP